MDTGALVLFSIFLNLWSTEASIPGILILSLRFSFVNGWGSGRAANRKSTLCGSSKAEI